MSLHIRDAAEVLVERCVLTSSEAQEQLNRLWA